jgi:hypothetical protein
MQRQTTGSDGGFPPPSPWSAFGIRRSLRVPDTTGGTQ